MKKLLAICTLLIFSMGCKDDSISDSIPLDLSSCFSPEFGLIEDEQFYYNITSGEIEINLDDPINISNKGYTITEGSKTIFVYRHFLENNFNIIDDEVELRFLFQIDEGMKSFSINTTDAFADAKFIYAECGVALNQVSGKITGSKNSDDNWTVIADLDIQRFNTVRKISFDKVFRK